MPDEGLAAAAGSSVLTVSDVTVRYGGLVALRDVTVEVPTGAIVGLVGPNGAGKSTLFGVVSGFVRPASGCVTIDGKDVTRSRPEQRARLGLARTFQHPRIFHGLTVREHLCLAHRLRYQRRRLFRDLVVPAPEAPVVEEERHAVDRLLDVLELWPSAHRDVGGLSLRAQRLVEVGRALAFGPRVILLDEPSSGLDSVETAHLATTLATAARAEGTALLLVEHDVGFVLGLADDVYVLDYGSVIAHGAAAAIRADEAVVSAYLGANSQRSGT